MASFNKGPPGQRGIGFGGFALKGSEEPETIKQSPAFTSPSSSRRQPRQSDSSRKLDDSRRRSPPVRRRSRSPRRRSRSPRRRSRSPRRRSRSPRRRSRSPRRRSRSPRRRSRSRSPRRRSSRSPRRQDSPVPSAPPPPAVGDLIPEVQRTFSEAPAQSVTEQHRIIPDQTRNIPEQTRSIPEQHMNIPEQTRIIPDQTRIIPEQTRIVPQEPRRVYEKPAPRNTVLGNYDDDELLAYAEQSLEEGSESEEEEDPLDAFMSGIETQIKTQDEKKKKKVEDVAEDGPSEKGQRCDLEQDDDQETYFKAMEENPNFVPPEEEDDMEVEYDEDGNPIYTPKKKIIIPLEPIDHSTLTYQPFGRDFYTEHSEIAALNPLQVIELRNKLGLKVSGHNPPKPVSSFAHFGFDHQTMATIRKQQYTKPTPIQAQAIPAAMSGRDVIGIARTGSGKTAAYIWPMIPHIVDQPELGPGEGPIAAILAPTRELCIQIHQECRKFTKAWKLRVVCAYGGGNMYEQEKALTAQCEIVVATPGRLIDHVKKKKVVLSRVSYLVLDECDRMYDLGFEPQVTSIVQHCRPDKQTLLFSATMKNKINRLCRQALESPIHIQEQYGSGSANQDVTQITYTYTRPDDKFRWLTTRLVEFTSTGSVLVFVTRKVNSEELAGKLQRCDYEIGLLHGDMSQYERNEILSSFKKQEFRILVATDVAARGLDIKEIKTVINYDVARDIDTHTHRVGRTGRAGQKGTAYTLLLKSDYHFAGDLVKHLEMACQEVPRGVLDLALLDPNFIKSRGNPRKGFGRSDEKLRPGLGSAPEGPMSARQKLGGMNALGGTGTRASEMKSAMKSNYMSRFSKASDSVQQGFSPDEKTFAKPGSSMYAGFAKATAHGPKPSVPLVTPAVNPFKAPTPPPTAPRHHATPPPTAPKKKSRWN